jgi:hypothetical protein
MRGYLPPVDTRLHCVVELRSMMTVPLSYHPRTYLPTHTPVHPFTSFTYPATSPSIYPTIQSVQQVTTVQVLQLSRYLGYHHKRSFLPTHLHTFLHTYLPTYLPSIYLNSCLPTYLPKYLHTVYLPTCLPAHLPKYLPKYLHANLHTTYLLPIHYMRTYTLTYILPT